jgi:hypothetical protein
VLIALFNRGTQHAHYLVRRENLGLNVNAGCWMRQMSGDKCEQSFLVVPSLKCKRRLGNFHDQPHIFKAAQSPGRNICIRRREVFRSTLYTKQMSRNHLRVIKSLSSLKRIYHSMRASQEHNAHHCSAAATPIKRVSPPSRSNEPWG